EPMKHLPVKEIGYAVAFVIAALLLYATSYMTLVSEETEETGFTGFGTARFPTIEHRPDGPRYKPRYRFGGEVAVQFFYLAYEVDVRVRPEKWLLRLYEVE